MKLVAMLVATLVLAVGVGVAASGHPASGQPAYAAGAYPVPEATKKTPKPKKTPTPAVMPSSVAPTFAPTRRPVDDEGDRWVQLALVGGGGLLAAVLAFFGIGALLRHRSRRPRS